ncbi:MAG: hypothetical protein F6K28_38195 [Microcoleus sp. SIO2G3]|nr:hypothetical protein [Microcoleus sp. SIO2G3]
MGNRLSPTNSVTRLQANAPARTARIDSARIVVHAWANRSVAVRGRVGSRKWGNSQKNASFTFARSHRSPDLRYPRLPNPQFAIVLRLSCRPIDRGYGGNGRGII